MSNETSEQWSIQDIVNENGKSQINNEPKETQKNKSKKPKTRVGLVPKNVVLHINNPKLNKIFEELKQIPVRTCPNASSVLLRVFLELSVDAYLEKYDLVKTMLSQLVLLEKVYKVKLVKY